MSLTQEELDHLAKLCRIGLSDEEKVRFGHQINDIITFVQQLQACDVEGIEPMAHPQDGIFLQPRKLSLQNNEKEGFDKELTEIVEKFLKNVNHPIKNRQIEVKSTIG